MVTKEKWLAHKACIEIARNELARTGDARALVGLAITLENAVYDLVLVKCCALAITETAGHFDSSQLNKTAIHYLRKDYGPRPKVKP